MTTLAIELRMVSAQNVQVTDDALIVDLSDGRTVSVPLAWFPRLLHGTPEERRAALLGLVQVAPRLLIDLSPVLLATAATDADAAFVRAATLQASDHELENAFMGQLRFAREFLKRGLYERACAEFRGVWNVLRDDTVDPDVFNGGEELCAQGRYEDGAQRIQRAFSAIVTSR